MISVHGTSGCWSRIPRETQRPASPMIWTKCVSARPQVFVRVVVVVREAADLPHGLLRHVDHVADVGGVTRRRPYRSSAVFSTDSRMRGFRNFGVTRSTRRPFRSHGKFALDRHEAKARNVAGLEFHEDVDITLGREVVAQYGAQTTPSARCSVDGKTPPARPNRSRCAGCLASIRS